jgi:hypothetical protein
MAPRTPNRKPARARRPASIALATLAAVLMGPTAPALADIQAPDGTVFHTFAECAYNTIRLTADPGPGHAAANLGLRNVEPPNTWVETEIKLPEFESDVLNQYYWNKLPGGTWDLYVYYYWQDGQGGYLTATERITDIRDSSGGNAEACPL